MARKRSSSSGIFASVFPSEGMTPNTTKDETKPLVPHVSFSASKPSLRHILSDNFAYFFFRMRNIGRRGPCDDSILPCSFVMILRRIISLCHGLLWYSENCCMWLQILNLCVTCTGIQRIRISNKQRTRSIYPSQTLTLRNRRFKMQFARRLRVQ